MILPVTCKVDTKKVLLIRVSDLNHRLWLTTTFTLLHRAEFHPRSLWAGDGTQPRAERPTGCLPHRISERQIEMCHLSRGAECIFPPLTSPTGIQMLTRIFPMRSIYLQSDQSVWSKLWRVLWIRIRHFCPLTCGVYFNQSLLFSSLPVFFCLFLSSSGAFVGFHFPKC